MSDYLDAHYDFLNTLNLKKTNEEIKCCKVKENYQNDNGQITCKVCSNIISNISINPEWRYYGSKDSKSNDPTRCGMPINPLLVESIDSNFSYTLSTIFLNTFRGSSKSFFT